MSLTIKLDETNVPTIYLAGRLDTETAPQLDATLEGVRSNAAIKRLVFDLSKLDYMSSAGIRCLVRARKIIEPRGGKVAVVNPQPAVRKVLEIVKAIPLGEIFKDVAEMDAYLDEIQRKITDET
jgi:anti-anti-sigma factor